MKYIHSNGIILECRDIGEVIYSLKSISLRSPIPIITHRIFDEDSARLLLQQIKENIPVERLR
jgi:hypothetical protein